MAADKTNPKPSVKTKSAASSSALVVGISVDSGSVKALVQLLGGLERPSEDAAGLAIVLVQNGKTEEGPVSRSQIEAATAFKINELKRSAKIKSRTIYLPPANATVRLSNGSIKVTAAKPDAAANGTQVDDFFQSLAAHQNENAAGVILTTDAAAGALGLKAISDAGGVTFVQKVDIDAANSTPDFAAVMELADHALTPAEIANELVQQTGYRGQAAKQNQSQIKEAIPEIAKILVAATHHNFKHYKTTTLQRRIWRRMRLLKIDNVATFITRLKEDESESQALFRELLISVTEFFRDEEAFELLAKNVIPKIFADRHAHDHVRFWVAGCATGEEAYSLAILCREHMDQLDDPPEVQIFATDIDARALEVCRKGRYPMAIKDDVSPARLKRFFKKSSDGYVVAKQLRELVLFSAHNLISDPPFSKIDMISCRNLLIYLGPHLQKKLIPLFHFALRPGGFLFLGPSENITSHGDLFNTLESRWRISQRKDTGVNDSEAIVAEPKTDQQDNVAETASPVAIDTQQQDLLEVMQRIVLDEFSPKSVVVNEESEILCASADMQKYLTVGTGNFQNNIIKMARDGLRIGLRATLLEAKAKRRRIVHDDLSVAVDGELQRVMLTVQPMPKVGEDEELFLVIFHDSGLPLTRTSDHSDAPSSFKNSADTNVAATSQIPRDELSGTDSSRWPQSPPRRIFNVQPTSAQDADSLIAHLERSLAATRKDLQKSLFDLESSNDELKASNEELVALNEEMQAANEELATSKDEVDTAVVAQTQAKDDLENLLRSTQVATIFLDEEFKIRRFTPAATELYGLIESDVGRPLAQLMPLADEIPPLPMVEQGGPDDKCELDAPRPASSLPAAERQGHTGKRQGHITDEHTFQTHSGKWFSRRVLPYINQQGQSNGIVLTFIDVTTERQAQQAAIRRRQQLKTLTDNVPALIAYVDSDQRHQFVNQSYADQFQIASADLIGESVLSIWGDANFVDLEEHLEAALAGERRVFEIEIGVDQLPEPATKEITYVPDFNADGSVAGVYVLAVDITQRKHWEQVLVDRESYLRQVIDNIGGFVGILETDGTLVDANKTATLAGGVSRDEVIGKPLWECYWWAHDSQIADDLRRAVKTAASGALVRYDVEVRMANDSRMMIDFMIAPVVDDDGEVVFLIPSGIDIGDRVEAQEKAIRRQQQLNLATEVGRLGSWTWDIPTDTISWSQRLHDLFGYSTDQFDGTPDAFLKIVVKGDRPVVEAVIHDILNQGLDAFEYECRCQRGTDGQQIWTQVRGVVDRDGDGTAVRATGIAVDITPRKERELALEFLASLQIELTDLTTVDNIMRVATARTAEFLDLTHCVAIDIDDSAATADVFYDHHASHAADLCGIYDMSDFWSDENRAALASGKLLAIDDTSAPDQPAKYRDSFRRLGAGAIVNAPSTRNKKLAFVLSSLKSQAHQWQPHETELLRELATSLYLRIERARADADLIASKEQLQLGIEVANFAMGHVDYKNDQVTLSAEAAELYGLGDEAIVITRDEIHATFHPDDRAELDECITASLDPYGEGRIGVEHRVLCPDGRVGWLNVRKQVFFDDRVDPPKPSHAIFVAQDVTQRKEAELAVTLNAARMRMAAETAGFGMLHVDLTDRTVVYSDELRRLVGMDGDARERIRLDRLPDWIHSDDRELCRRYYIDVFMIPENSDKSIDHRIVRPDGEVRWVRLRSKPIYSGAGESRRPSQLIGTMLDITQQREFEKSLEEARALAELANESKSEFLANMSHEIRTPMTAILGYADILNRHLADPDNRNCVSIIRSNGQFLLEIINDILDISKIEAGKLELNRVEFRLDQLVADVQSLMSVRAAEKEIFFNVEYEGMIPETIHSDDKRLKQVLVNLIGNAIKFTEEGGVTLSIGMKDSEARTFIRFDVIDTGIGMSPYQTKKLFQPFTQADSSVGRKFGGTGLGLTISQRLARMLNGDIAFESKLGGGSKFTLTVEISGNDETQMIRPQTTTSLTQEEDDSATDSNKPRLTGKYLVVDDRREIRFIAQHFIEDAGGKVTTAENGQEAADVVEAAIGKGTIFDVIVMDMQMPIMDGYEAARRLRIMDYDGPIIALTAHAMDGDRDACIEAGCTDYISKPLNGPKFVELLASYLDRD